MRFRTIKTGMLSPDQRAQMFQLMSRYYDGIDQEQFNQDLSEKSDVILLTGDNRIQGFTTILRIDRTYGNRHISGVFSGDTVLNKDFWGNRALTIAFGLYLSKMVLASPFRTHYWFLMSKGYKTYLLMTNNTLHHYPCHRRATPAKFQELIDAFYGDRYEGDYSSAEGLVVPSVETYRLKQTVAAIEPRHMANPKISFFAQKNPRWNEGIELACVSAINLKTVLYFTSTLLARQIRSSVAAAWKRVFRLRPARA